MINTDFRKLNTETLEAIVANRHRVMNFYRSRGFLYEDLGLVRKFYEEIKLFINTKKERKEAA